MAVLVTGATGFVGQAFAEVFHLGAQVADLLDGRVYVGKFVRTGFGKFKLLLKISGFC